MKRARYVLTVVLLVSACTGGKVDSMAAKGASAVSGNEVASTCPSTDFHVFVNSFTEDPSVQRSFTENPLEEESIDVSANPEPKAVTALISEIHFPVLPGEKEREAEGLVLSVTSVTTAQAILELAKPDTGYQVKYYFKFQDCWVLYRKKDESI